MTTAHDPHQFQSATDALDFILAGNAYFTLRSLKTGKRYTYRVAVAKDSRDTPTPLHFVSVLTGPDNSSDYTYIGTIRDRTFRWGKRGGLDAKAPSVQAIEWALAQLVAGRLPTSLEVWHQGRCGRCGRLLTVPESIDRGLGPECAGKSTFAATAVFAPASSDAEAGTP